MQSTDAMLIHSKSGLANEHLFYKSDFVVYLEGGEVSFTKEQVLDGGFSDSTLDILFWNRIFQHFAPSKTFKLKSVGAKLVVLEIAHEIVQNNIPNRLVEWTMNSMKFSIQGSFIEMYLHTWL